MDYEYRDGRLFADGADLSAIAEAHGTPCYVYSARTLSRHWHAYDEALAGRAHRVCYAVKANHNLSLLKLLDRFGSGFDIVSGGELDRVLAAGARADSIVFSGVGKTRTEIARAIQAGIGCINVESADELDRVSSTAAEQQRVVDIAVRVNPNVDAGTHPYISTGLRENKFGVPPEQALSMYRSAAAHAWLEPAGIACHIGSQLVSVAPVIDAVREITGMADALAAEGIRLGHVDVGGGLGVRYEQERPPSIGEFVAALAREVPERYAVTVEPGRSLVATAGLLLTRVEYLKRTEARNFVIVDAAMNDLLRPALYDAWHEVLAVGEDVGDVVPDCDVVGPVCESGDWLARGRTLRVAEGALLAIDAAGAYAHVMASNYNARPRPPEVLADGAAFRLVRRRESSETLMADERACLDR